MFCENCGKKLGEKQQFCENCGFKKSGSRRSFRFFIKIKKLFIKYLPDLLIILGVSFFVYIILANKKGFYDEDAAFYATLAVMIGLDILIRRYFIKKK